MDTARRPLVAGNWKMNGGRQSLNDFQALLSATHDSPCEYVICPPATLLMAFESLSRSSQRIHLGAQDLTPLDFGARTGDINGDMLAECGAQYVILGHSERRQYHGETSPLIREKVLHAWKAGLVALVCVGETLEERQLGLTKDILSLQVKQSVPATAKVSNTVIVYEPQWSIGSGLIPTNEELHDAFSHLREVLEQHLCDSETIRLMYGGSVNSANASALLTVKGIEGFLVGKSSLNPSEFLQIGRAFSVANT